MTCIAALKYKQRVVFISDSQSTAGFTKYNHNDGLTSKLCRYFDDETSLIEHTGDTNNLAIAKDIPNLFTNFDENHPVFNEKYVREVMCEMIRKEFTDLKIYRSAKTHKVPSRFIVAKDDKCFEITPEGGIINIEEVIFEGCGQAAALGNFISSPNDLDLFIKSLKGVDAACRFDNGCSYPILVASTKPNTFYSLTKEDVDDIINGRKELDL